MSFGLDIGVPNSDAELTQFTKELSKTPNGPPTWLGVVYNDDPNLYYMNLNTGLPYNGKFSFIDPPNVFQVNRCVKIFNDPQNNKFTDAPETDCGLIYNYLCQDKTSNSVQSTQKISKPIVLKKRI